MLLFLKHTGGFLVYLDWADVRTINVLEALRDPRLFQEVGDLTAIIYVR
ncbi:hypothetical protein [Halotia branconii]|uniref:Uncharacterized protein n=1 Tax=Halotia branconii CENA392 TaxID=1539056 RepID=A0AAJ6NR07_9CYAN|nr:hypothetical protein [Halotia branconii]WGV24936.1 hypothetical protein QI031_24715 [Halotia branconii CENA392]